MVGGESTPPKFRGHGLHIWRVHPCVVKSCAVRPVFAWVVGELRAAGTSNVQGPVKHNASPGEQSEAPRPRWKPLQQQNPGPENQDGQHMLEQPRGSFSDKSPKNNLGGVVAPLGSLEKRGATR